jgi:hypothetical protein
MKSQCHIIEEAYIAGQKSYRKSIIVTNLIEVDVVELGSWTPMGKNEMGILVKPLYIYVFLVYIEDFPGNSKSYACFFNSSRVQWSYSL